MCCRYSEWRFISEHQSQSEDMVPTGISQCILVEDSLLFRERMIIGPKLLHLFSSRTALLFRTTRHSLLKDINTGLNLDSMEVHSWQGTFQNGNSIHTIREP